MSGWRRSHFAMNGSAAATNGPVTRGRDTTTTRGLRPRLRPRLWVSYSPAMAARPTDPTPAAIPARGRPARRGMAPGKKPLLGAAVMVMLGSFMPWVDTAVGSVSGARGPGLWTFYAAMLGFAGVMVPLRRVAGAQAAVLGLVSVALPTWQVVHLLGLVGSAGWRPGPGLVLVFGGGVVALVAAWRLLLNRG